MLSEKVFSFLSVCFYFFNFFKILFVRERERASKHKQGELQAEGQEEAGSQPSKDPDGGLDPRTPGLRPESKADA